VHLLHLEGAQRRQIRQRIGVHCATAQVAVQAKCANFVLDLYSS